MAGSQVIFAECMSNVLIDRPGRCTGHRLGFTDEFLLRCVCGGWCSLRNRKYETLLILLSWAFDTCHIWHSWESMFRKMNLSSNKTSALAHLLEFDRERKDNEPDLPRSRFISQEISERMRLLQQGAAVSQLYRQASDSFTHVFLCFISSLQ